MHRYLRYLEEQNLLIMKEQQNKVVQPDTYCKQNRDGDGH